MRKLFLLLTITGLTFSTGCRLFCDCPSRSYHERPVIVTPAGQPN